MTLIAKSGIQPPNQLGQLIHGVSGTLAIVLMIVHAAWSTVVLVGHHPRRKQTFHRLSIVVWSIWLIPYLADMVMGAL